LHALPISLTNPSMEDESEAAWLVIGERSITGIASASMTHNFGLCNGSWMKAVSTSPMGVVSYHSLLCQVQSFTLLYVYIKQNLRNNNIFLP